MTFSTVGRAIVSILTLITIVAMVYLVYLGFAIHQPLLIVSCGLIGITASYFSYNDYLHYFKHKD